MKKALVLVVLAACAITLIAFPGCKKGEKANPKTEPEAHMQEMLKKSMEASKAAVAVNVNGRPVTMFALYREMNILGPRYLASGAKQTPELDQKVRSEALSNVIFWELAVQEARQRGMQVKPEIVDEQLARMKKDLGSEEAYRKYLETNGLSESEFRKITEDDALFEMIATQEVDAKITVSEAAVRERYNREKANFKKNPNHKEVSFEAAKGMIEQKLREEAAQKRMRAWEKELKKNAKIEIVDKSLVSAHKEK
jgi:hypothetical protein